mmetsp:Transcript_74497/g.206936  ORF Transcript_74497/g.206936 Transcript_74497/m.206936 type:complete len:173 (-) Transcript_74497:32-550(-)
MVAPSFRLARCWCLAVHVLAFFWVEVAAFSDGDFKASALRRSGRIPNHPVGTSEADSEAWRGGLSLAQGPPGAQPLEYATKKKPGGSGYLVRPQGSSYTAGGSSGSISSAVFASARANVDAYDQNKDSSHYLPIYPVDQTLPRLPDADGDPFNDLVWKPNGPPPLLRDQGKR